eukprot:gene2153-18203_t
MISLTDSFRKAAAGSCKFPDQQSAYRMDRHEQEKEKPTPIVSTKELYADPSLPRKIQQICFGVQTPQEIVKCGVFPAFERSLYKMPERSPHPNGVLDRRLGISGKSAVCETCGNKLAECAGHFAYIKLELPVFHIGYFKNTLQLLQCICKNCSRVLLPDDERMQWLRRFRSPRIERVQREQLFKKVLDRCKRTKLCPYCGESNLTVKKTTGALKLIHDKYNKNPNLLDQYKDTMVEALRYNEQIRQHVHNVADDLHPLRVQSLGLPVYNLMENWDFLQIQCAMLVNSDMPGVPPSMQTVGRPLRGYVQRLKGKTDGEKQFLKYGDRRKAAADLSVGSIVERHLDDGDNGEIMISANQDFLTFAYLFSSKDVFLTRAEFSLMCSYMADACE